MCAGPWPAPPPQKNSLFNCCLGEFSIYFWVDFSLGFIFMNRLFIFWRAGRITGFYMRAFLVSNTSANVVCLLVSHGTRTVVPWVEIWLFLTPPIHPNILSTQTFIMTTASRGCNYLKNVFGSKKVAYTDNPNSPLTKRKVWGYASLQTTGTSECVRFIRWLPFNI